MRTLKFRVWDVESECYIDETDWAGITPEGQNIWLVEEEEVSVLPILGEFIIEQYTGLKDNNGKEIYEGDIVSFSIPHFDKSTLGYDGETELVGKIVFDYDRFCIEDKDGVFYDLCSAEEGEVIGNIHENPELLGGE